MFGTPASSQDVEVGQPPSDAISSLSWSPTADFIAVGSWDNNVRVYEMDPSNGQTRPVTSYSHDSPVLSVCWNKEGNKIFSGSADKTVKVYDVSTGQSNKLGDHQDTVKGVVWADAQGGVLASASWDKTLKYWDLRSPQPVATVSLPERAYSMATSSTLLLIATADRHLCLFNLTSPTTIFKQVYSPLKFQTRSVACMPEGKGYAVASIEGRVSVNFFSDAPAPYSFKCHRKDLPGQNTSVNASQSKYQKATWSVNSLSFHQQLGSLATAGTDASFSFWDLEGKSKLKTFDERGGPIVATEFHRSGEWFAYAISYDWSNGFSPNMPQVPNKIFLHKVQREEVNRKR
ncbi:WD40 repeat-like protein [Atractiella rhizophila]|nr:WD40 repeat-like protein [Atractiella rhizophila]